MSLNIGLDIPVQHFDKVCRVCLSYSESLISIHEVVFTSVSSEGTDQLLLSPVLELQKYCSVLVHKNDLKPQNTCETCIKSLAKAFNILGQFKQSNVHLDNILKNHANIIKNSMSNEMIIPSNYAILPQNSSDNKMNDWSTSATGITSELIFNIDEDQEIKLEAPLEAPQVQFPNENSAFMSGPYLDLLLDSENGNKQSLLLSSKSEDDFITIVENSVCADSIIIESEFMEEDMENLKVEVNQLNSQERRLDHTYCITENKLSNKMHTGRSTARKPKMVTQRSEKVIREQQVRRILQRYQHENEIFKCKFCEGLKFEGMDKIIDHMITVHPLNDECVFCTRKCSKLLLLVAHVASHAKEWGSRCSKCGIQFKNSDTRRAHFTSGDHKKYTTNCHICNRKFTHNYKLKLHIQEVHLNKGRYRTVCPICGLVLKYKANLNRHLLVHKEINERKSFLCEHCAKSFTTSTNLNQHILIVHENQIQLRGNSQPIKKTKAKRMIYSCDYCPRTFSGKGAFFKHRTAHPECKNIACPMCEKVLPNPEKYRQHRIADHSTYRCDDCHKGWPTKESLAAHLFQVHKASDKMCAFCPASFKSPHSLRCHEYTHTKEKPYSCDFCDKKFTQKHHVDQHVSSVHTKVKKHQCHICDKSFIYNYCLKAHLRYHMGCKPFNCPYCAKTFTDTVGRHKHVKQFHPDRMEDFVLFKKLYQNEEVRRAENLLVSIGSESDTNGEDVGF